MALHEKNLPFEMVFFERGHRPPELSEVSARAKSPTLFDETSRVYESQVVLEYLEDRYPDPRLLPTTASGRADVRMFVTRVTEELAPKVGALVSESMKAQGDASRLAAPVQSFLEALTAWDRHFGVRPFAVGNELSVADITLYPFFPVVRRAAGIKIGGDLPHLRGWIDRMAARPSARVPEPA